MRTGADAGDVEPAAPGRRRAAARSASRAPRRPTGCRRSARRARRRARRHRAASRGCPSPSSENETGPRLDAMSSLGVVPCGEAIGRSCTGPRRSPVSDSAWPCRTQPSRVSRRETGWRTTWVWPRIQWPSQLHNAHPEGWRDRPGEAPATITEHARAACAVRRRFRRPAWALATARPPGQVPTPARDHRSPGKMRREASLHESRRQDPVRTSAPQVRSPAANAVQSYDLGGHARLCAVFRAA